ncbi:unnamed protein product [Amoebophrya sp. A25]|nr:unnamed protein product [Amoebophrya sp. A25]|eukprot:GSA25T00018617001.1
MRHFSQSSLILILSEAMVDVVTLCSYNLYKFPLHVKHSHSSII